MTQPQNGDDPVSCYTAGYRIFNGVPELVREYVKGTKTLDYGCGYGFSTRFLRSLGLKVDVAVNQDQAINPVGGEDRPPQGNYYILQNGTIPTCFDEQYDFVFASFTLVEIAGDRKELFDAVVEIARVMKRGGTFVTIVNCEDTCNDAWSAACMESKDSLDPNGGGEAGKAMKKGMCQYFWTEMDYQTAMNDAGLVVLECIHKPVDMNDENGCSWSIERMSPVKIYVAQKLLSATSNKVAVKFSGNE